MAGRLWLGFIVLSVFAMAAAVAAYAGFRAGPRLHDRPLAQNRTAIRRARPLSARP
jgi:hypothetical protein